MDTRLLEDALVLIEEGSMSAAAARRNITQPAFSRRIKALEDWLGAPLVERFPNRVQLTEALTAREGEIRALLASLGRFRAQSPLDRTTFVVATQHSLAIAVFPEIHAKIRAAEGVDLVRLRTRNQDETVSLFLKHEVDLLLSYQAHGWPRLPFDETVIQRIWRRDVLVPVVGGALRFRLSEDGVPAGDTPVLRYPKDSLFERIIAAYPGAEALIQPEAAVIESAFVASVVALIQQGAGVGWVPQSLIRDDLRRGTMVPVSARFGRIPMDVMLSAYRHNTAGRRVLATLVPEESPVSG